LARLVDSIERSGVLEPATVAKLNTLVADGKMTEADLRVFARLVSEVKAGRGSSAAGMDKAQLQDYLSCLVKNAADPNQINQGLHASCTAVAMMRDMARNDTASFMSMALQLVDKGEMRGKNGETAQVNITALKSSLVDKSGKFPEADICERLIAATLMGHAVGKNATYDHQTGSSTGVMGGAHINGLVGCSPSQYARIASFLKGGEQTVVEGDAAQAALRQPINKPLLVDIRWSPEGKDANHAILVTKIENGRVYYENPHGSNTLDKNGPPGRRSEGKPGLESMPVEEFMARVNRVVVPVGSGNPPAVAITERGDKILQGIIAGTQDLTVHYDPSAGQFNKTSIKQLTPKELVELEERFPEKKPLIEQEVKRRKVQELADLEAGRDLRNGHRPRMPLPNSNTRSPL
jgi:hypothetical protein